MPYGKVASYGTVWRCSTRVRQKTEDIYDVTRISDTNERYRTAVRQLLDNPTSGA